MSKPNVKQLYFAFFIWLPLTISALIGLLAGPGLLISEVLDYTTKNAAYLGAVVLCLSILIIKWSIRWIDRHDDLMDQMV